MSVLVKFCAFENFKQTKTHQQAIIEMQKYDQNISCFYQAWIADRNLVFHIKTTMLVPSLNFGNDLKMVLIQASMKYVMQLELHASIIFTIKYFIKIVNLFMMKHTYNLQTTMAFRRPKIMDFYYCPIL